MPQHPRPHTGQAQSKYMFLNTSHVAELITLHAKRSNHSHGVRFANRLPQAAPDSDHNKMCQKASSALTAGVSPAAQLHALPPEDSELHRNEEALRPPLGR